jgi:hypothetical protein
MQQRQVAAGQRPAGRDHCVIVVVADSKASDDPGIEEPLLVTGPAALGYLKA